MARLVERYIANSPGRFTHALSPFASITMAQFMNDSRSSSRNNHAEVLLHVIDRWKWWGALSIVAALVMAYWYLPIAIHNDKLVEFLRSIITNLIPVFLLFTASWSIFRTVDAIRQQRERQYTVDAVAIKVIQEILPLIDRRRTVYRRFTDVPWSDMIHDSDSLDIIVQYFDSWAKTHKDALSGLFARGGTVRVLLPDPEDRAVLDQIESRFLDHEQSNIRGKIENTPIRFAAIRESTQSSGKLEVRFTKLPIWYCALRFSNGFVALSPFESKREVGVNSPCFVLRGSEAQDLVHWFDVEFDHLWTSARTWTS